MKKKLVFPVLSIILLLMLACAISYEGVKFSDDPEPIEMMKSQLATQMNEEQSIPEPEQAASIPEPTYQPAAPQNSEVETKNASPKEYSVTAVDFDCICQVNGNVTKEFKFNGDQLEIPDGEGGMQAYEKIGDNTYKRSWMGYYILASGTGDDRTETKVDEERSSVIILKDGGYVMEHYQGSSSSPCCVHTFTEVK